MSTRLRVKDRPKVESININFRVDSEDYPEILEAVDNFAGGNISEFMRNAVAEYMEKWEKKEV